MYIKWKGKISAISSVSVKMVPCQYRGVSFHKLKLTENGAWICYNIHLYIVFSGVINYPSMPQLQFNSGLLVIPSSRYTVVEVRRVRNYIPKLVWVWLLIHDLSFINSLRPSDAIWRHRSGSTLAQVMAWCLTYGTKPLPEPMLTYHLNWNLPGANELKQSNLPNTVLASHTEARTHNDNLSCLPTYGSVSNVSDKIG